MTTSLQLNKHLPLFNAYLQVHQTKRCRNHWLHFCLHFCLHCAHDLWNYSRFCL